MTFDFKPLLLALTIALAGHNVSAQTDEQHYDSARGWNIVALFD